MVGIATNDFRAFIQAYVQPVVLHCITMKKELEWIKVITISLDFNL